MNNIKKSKATLSHLNLRNIATETDVGGSTTNKDNQQLAEKQEKITNTETEHPQSWIT